MVESRGSGQEQQQQQQPLSHTLESPTNPLPKRRRIGLACNTCRTRKSRCDGNRPRCHTCSELKLDECVYENHPTSTNVILPKDHLSGIENRLKKVEQVLDQLTAAGSANQLLPYMQNTSPRSAPTERSSHNFVQDQIDEEDQVDEDDGNGELGESEEVTDGMGAVVFSAEKEFRYFGPSSNIAFIRRICYAISHTPNNIVPDVNGNDTAAVNGPDLNQLSIGVMSISRPPVSQSENTPGGPSGQSKAKINIYELPEDAKVREMLRHFFQDTGALFPYLHEKTFWDTYNDLRKHDFKEVRRTWLGLLNIILALVTSIRKAVRLYDKQMFKATSLDAVQYLLVMGQYLQGTQKSLQAWTVHGLTVKAAFQIGLHSREANKGFSPLEQEIRKRTWYGCVILDRTLSMTFGRPATIPDDYVRLELPRSLDDEDICGIEDAVRLNSIPFFNSTIKLYGILWNVIKLSYGSNIGCDEEISAIDAALTPFKLEQQLLEWESCLPPNLQLRASPCEIPIDLPDPIEKYRVILTLRSHNLRLLLHRPIFTRYLDIIAKRDFTGPDPAILLQVGMNSLHSSIKSAILIIGMVSRINNCGARSMLGAWWFTLYYTFNAALVLYASLVIYNNENILITPPPVPIEEITAAIYAAITTLQSLDGDNPTTNHCAEYLGRLLSLMATKDNFSLFHNGNIMARATDTGLSHDQIPALPNFENNGMLGNLGFSRPNSGGDLGEFMLYGDFEYLDQINFTS